MILTGENKEESLFQCHFVNRKFQMDWSWIEPGTPRWRAGN